MTPEPVVLVVTYVVALRWKSPRLAMPIGQTKQKALKPKTAEVPTTPAKIPVETTPFLVSILVTGQRRKTVGSAFLMRASSMAV